MADTTNKMGLIGCVSYIVGNVVGSGIFITPGYVLKDTGSAGWSTIIWLLCGAISFLGAISYIELGTGIPSDGGDFAYTTFVGWHALAFAFMWVSALLTYPGSTAVQILTFGDYMTNGLAPYIPILQDAEWATFTKYAVAYMLLFVCTGMNFFAIDKAATKFQIIVTFAKGIILMIIIGVGAAWLVQRNSANRDAIVSMAGTNFAPGSIIMAVYSSLWAYAGWDILNYGAPAVDNPRRNMPLALMGGILIVTFIYVCSNTAFIAVLGTEGVMNSSAVASDFAKASMGWAAPLVPFATAILIVGTVNANIFCTSRIIYEAARQGHLPRFLAAKNNESDSPRAALLLQALTAFLCTWVDIETIINYVSFIMWAQKLVTMFALLKIRYTNMEMDKGVIRVPIVITIAFTVISILLVCLPFIADWKVTIIGVLCVSGGLVLYFALVRPKEPTRVVAAINNTISKVICKVLNCDMSHLDRKEPDASEDELQKLNAEKPPLKSQEIQESVQESV